MTLERAPQVQELTEASTSSAAAQQTLVQLQQERQDVLDQLSTASGEAQQLRDSLATLQQVPQLCIVAPAAACLASLASSPLYLG